MRAWCPHHSFRSLFVLCARTAVTLGLMHGGDNTAYRFVLGARYEARLRSNTFNFFKFIPMFSSTRNIGCVLLPAVVQVYSFVKLDLCLNESFISVCCQTAIPELCKCQLDHRCWRSSTIHFIWLVSTMSNFHSILVIKNCIQVVPLWCLTSLNTFTSTNMIKCSL